MADDEDPEKSSGNAKKSRNPVPEWHETCIGIWTKSTKGEIDKTNKRNRICNGINVVKINKFADPKKIKPSQTRGLQVTIQEIEEDIEKSVNQTKSKDPKKYEFPPEDMGLGKRIIEILNKQKNHMEKGIKDIAENGIKPSEVWNGFSDIMSSWYKTSARIVSYCHPQEKLSQMYAFGAERLKDLRKRVGGDDRKK
ncbi:uncharacterized protein LOC116602247 [Nematostella vectensis]|uniref:uncharacterized protein LOC116602247 n=1 Tax=Nematostella vectensis TaxID=45351 RepID=UPI00207774F0|nr:uncharacterized protein LOC116602247 [Nematostella vectensis]